MRNCGYAGAVAGVEEADGCAGAAAGVTGPAAEPWGSPSQGTACLLVFYSDLDAAGGGRPRGSWRPVRAQLGSGESVGTEAGARLAGAAEVGREWMRQLAMQTAPFGDGGGGNPWVSVSNNWAESCALHHCRGCRRDQLAASDESLSLCMLNWKRQGQARAASNTQIKSACGPGEG